MGANHREGAMWRPIVAIKEVPSGREQALDRLEALVVRDLAAEVAPEHFNRVEPGTVGRSVGKDTNTSRPAAARTTISTSSSSCVPAFSQAT